MPEINNKCMTLSLQEAIASIQQHPVQAKLVFEQVIERNLLDQPIRPNAWTPRQIFHHLADSHLNSYTRIKLAITEENPTVKPYNEKAWVKLQDVSEIPVEVSLQILEGIHSRISSVLRYISSDQPDLLGNTFFHPESGDRTVKDYIISFASHGVSHLNGIRKLLEN